METRKGRKIKRQTERARIETDRETDRDKKRFFLRIRRTEREGENSDRQRQEKKN